MISKAAELYNAAEHFRLVLREHGVDRDAVEDPLLEWMDELWWQMSETERAATEVRLGSPRRHKEPR
jgi:hypothetical protein